MSKSCSVALVLSVLTACSLSAQTIKIDFGTPGSSPSAAYRAAGVPGVWNTISGAQFQTFSLLDIDGNPTAATVRNIGGSALLAANDVGTVGDDEALMDEYLVTFTPLEVCLFFNGLENGEYEVVQYTLAPTLPNVKSRVTVDDSPTGAQIVGGAWPGQQQLGVTYTIHRTAVVNGGIGSHSGLSNLPGSDRGALNGVEIRKLPPLLRGDLNCDGIVSVGDIATFVLALTDEPAYRTAQPFCDAARADINADGLVSVGDIGAFVGLLVGASE